MSNIKDIVPPLDLCRKIPFPKKNFRDSLFAWVPRFKGKGEWREIVRYELYLRPTNNDSQCIPAPTLQEILNELPKYNENEVTLACVPSFLPGDKGRIFGEAWSVGYTAKSSVTDATPTTAAMKIWLELNKER